MKILSIGNSFSQDAHKWLHQLANQCKYELETVNLYIGGCSLETHWDNVVSDNAFYDLEINGNEGSEKISILSALNMEQWDIITVQQVSQLSGMPDSYEPFLGNLVSFVRDQCPMAKIYFHQTWAYEIDSAHAGFANYNNDQKQMYDCIVSTAKSKSESINADMIPVGTVIQYIRENIPEFDYKHNGLSLCRDGFHLTFDYGRYAAAATWLHTLTGRPVPICNFNDFDSDLISKITIAVNRICDEKRV